MRSFKQVLLVIVLTLLVSVPITAVVSLFVIEQRSNDVVRQWTSPDGAFSLSVLKGQRDWLRGNPQRYFIVLGQGTQTSYGHAIDFSFYTVEGYEGEQAIQDSQVAWSDDGVTLTTGAGHTLFVPARMYQNGR
jgi:hypothetical protein